MSALFILNLYYKNEVFKLERGDSKAVNFPINMGSEIFSIKLHKWFCYDEQFNYEKKEDFSECLYLTKYTGESLEKNKKASAVAMEKKRELLLKHPKFHKYIESKKIEEYKGNNLMWDVLGEDDYFNIIRVTNEEELAILKESEYEATLNKNNI